MVARLPREKGNFDKSPYPAKAGFPPLQRGTLGRFYFLKVIQTERLSASETARDPPWRIRAIMHEQIALHFDREISKNEACPQKTKNPEQEAAPHSEAAFHAGFFSRAMSAWEIEKGGYCK
ncbi:MAG: hypothetical protein WCV72_04690 [Patescibacteria group bacterium]